MDGESDVLRVKAEHDSGRALEVPEKGYVFEHQVLEPEVRLRRVGVPHLRGEARLVKAEAVCVGENGVDNVGASVAGRVVKGAKSVLEACPGEDSTGRVDM